MNRADCKMHKNHDDGLESEYRSKLEMLLSAQE